MKFSYLAIITGFLLSGCNQISLHPISSQQSDYSEPLFGQLEFTATPFQQSQYLENESNNINYDIPNRIPSQDIFDQLVWVGMGGDQSNSSNQINCDNCEVYATSNQNNNILLEGFDSKQKLRLIFYRSFNDECGSYIIGKYVGSLDVQVDNNGSIAIELSGNKNDIFIYSVYELDSNKLLWRWNLPLIEADCSQQSELEEVQKYACGNNIFTNLSVGDRARVTYSTGQSVRLRSEPEINKSNIIDSIPEGAQMVIIEGPACNDGHIWWYVETANHEKGWMANGTSKNWFIEPYP